MAKCIFSRAQANKPLVANKPALKEAGEPGKKAGTASVDLAGQGLTAGREGECTAQKGVALEMRSDK